MEKRIKTGGRVAGTPNRSTSETKAVLQATLSAEIDKIPELLAELGPKEKLEAITRLLPFILPKQSDILVQAEEKEHNFTPITIQLLDGNRD